MRTCRRREKESARTWSQHADGRKGAELAGVDSSSTAEERAVTYVLRLEIRVNDLALLVKIVETEEDLFSDLLNDVRRNSSVLIPLDEAEQVLSQDLEHHANMRSIGTSVAKVVEELNDMSPAGMVRIRGDETLEELDLVESGLGVVSVRLDDLESDVTLNPVVSERKRSQRSWSSEQTIREERREGDFEVAPLRPSHS